MPKLKLGEVTFDPHMLMGLALLVILAGIVTVLLQNPSQNKEVLSIIIGALLTQLGNVYNFWFGDTKKSTGQSDTINTLAAAAAAPVTETTTTKTSKT